MTRRRLELIRYALIALSFAAIVGMWTEPEGVSPLLLFFAFTVTAIPAAMVSLHLHQPKFLKSLDRPKQ